MKTMTSSPPPQGHETLHVDEAWSNIVASKVLSQGDVTRIARLKRISLPTRWVPYFQENQMKWWQPIKPMITVWCMMVSQNLRTVSMPWRGWHAITRNLFWWPGCKVSTFRTAYLLGSLLSKAYLSVPRERLQPAMHVHMVTSLGVGEAGLVNCLVSPKIVCLLRHPPLANCWL